MATRKVLINRHSTRPEAPVASEMFHGEIAVSHPTDLSATTIYTRNGNVMIPFISCAQTISIIDDKIKAVNVIYDVKEGENEPHIEVDRTEEGSAVTFTLTSKDIESKAEFEAFSAETKARIDKNVSTITDTLGIISALTDVVITGVTGDEIIIATIDEHSTSSNTYSVTHKQALATNGFNKLTTDAYGHVTASTAVATADIEGLGFKNSAWTEEKIASAITALDVTDTAVAGQYVNAVSEADGKISVSRADVSKAPLNDYAKGSDATAVAATDTVNQAISKLENQIDNAKAAATTKVEKDANANHLTLESSTAADGSVTYTIGEDNIASKTDLDALSGDVIEYVKVVSGNIETVIQAMDKAASAEDGKVVTTVSEVDGVVSETKANVKDLQLGGYVKDTTATGDIAGTDTINAALSKLENKANAITIANADGSINVTTGATGTDINVNIKSGEKVLAKDGAAGLYTDIDLVKITTGLPATVKERYQLLATDDSQIGVNIDVPKDSHIVSINYITTGEHAQNLEYVYIDASGVTQTTYVDMSELVLEAEFASGVTVTDHIAHGVVDPTTENFLTVGADGFKVSGVQDAIDAKVNALDVTGDTAVAGQYVAAIEQTDGVVAVKTRANVSEAVLTNYAKGSDATAVAATDTVNQAISKLENQVDAAKAAATTKVVEGTDAGNNMTITPTTSPTDGSVTYTVNLVDIASSTALTAEIAARKAVDGQNGDTYAANAGTNFISDATSLNDADVKLDAAIKALSGDTDAAIKALDSVGSASTTGHYLTSVTITDGKITAVGEVAVPANVAITATTDAAGDTASAVLTGVTASGPDNHELTFGMSNKVFSATTADSTITSQSAQTSVSASMAYELSSAATITSGQVTDLIDGIKNTEVNSATTAKSADTAASADKVANALTMTDGTATQTYDGSEAKSLTFGTNTAAGNSMSMTSAGVVDVEVIDCGEY